MSLVINFSIDKRTESMLGITSIQKCSLIHLVIPIIKSISLNIHKTGMRRELRKESIAKIIQSSTGGSNSEPCTFQESALTTELYRRLSVKVVSTDM